MREAEWHIKKIKEGQITNNKNALIVEGKTDLIAFTIFLTSIDPLWQEQWVLAEVGGKRNVVEILTKEPMWLGIVDRDEWDDSQITRKQEALPNLMILPRFCIENYLVIPEEIWSSLPEKRKRIFETKDIAIGQIRGGITDNIDRWVQFSALWAIVSPLWDELKNRGFNRSLLALEVVNSEAEIRAKFSEWHVQLEPEVIWQRYQNKYNEIRTLELDKILRIHVHGKKFFQQVVTPTLTQLLNIQSAVSAKDLFQTMQVPADLAFVWARMNLNQQ
ncbi:hypothetical protein ACET7O_01000 [Aeromonas veronii]